MIYRLCVGPSIALAMGLAKILDLKSILRWIDSKVSLSSYILKHNGIDCGF